MVLILTEERFHHSSLWWSLRLFCVDEEQHLSTTTWLSSAVSLQFLLKTNFSLVRPIKDLKNSWSLKPQNSSSPNIVCRNQLKYFSMNTNLTKSSSDCSVCLCGSLIHCLSLQCTFGVTPTWFPYAGPSNTYLSDIFWLTSTSCRESVSDFHSWCLPLLKMKIPCCNFFRLTGMEENIFKTITAK